MSDAKLKCPYCGHREFAIVDYLNRKGRGFSTLKNSRAKFECGNCGHKEVI
jgi:DNA-directed RNA polymerase subunit RPC12/RpoP